MTNKTEAPMTTLEKALSVVCAVTVIAALYGWYRPVTPQVQTVKQFVQVPVEKIVTKIKTVAVPVTTVVTYEKQVVVQKLALPDWINTDTDMQVIAQGDVGPYLGTTSVVSLLNTKTGKASLIMKQKPLPVIAFENTGEVGVNYYPLSYKAGIISLIARYRFLRIMNLHVELNGEVDTADTAKAGVGIVYQF